MEFCLRDLSATPWVSQEMLRYDEGGAWSLKDILNARMERSVLVELGQPSAENTMEIAQTSLPDALLLVLGASKRPAAIPHLRLDNFEANRLRIPELKLAKALSASSPYLWTASAGAMSSCHFDIANNLIVQLSGVREFKIRRPLYLEKFPEINSLLRGYFSRNTHNVDYELRVTLNPGDVLFLPKGWWHEVVCHSLSIGVNYFVFHTIFVPLLRIFAKIRHSCGIRAVSDEFLLDLDKI